MKIYKDKLAYFHYNDYGFVELYTIGFDGCMGFFFNGNIIHVFDRHHIISTGYTANADRNNVGEERGLF